MNQGDASTARKLLTLLSRDERRKLVALFGLMLVAMVLETLGIGLVLPTLAFLTNGDVGRRVPVLQPLVDAFANSPRTTLVVAGMSALVLVYVVKTLFLGVLAWKQSRFSYDLYSSLSQRLFSLYLSQPYTFHLQRNSAQLISSISGEVLVFTSEGVTPALALCAEALVLLALGLLLVAVEPFGALVVGGMIGLAGWVFYEFSRRHSDRWGAARQQHDELAVQHLQQGLGAAKEVILLGREREFLAQFSWHNVRRANAAQRHDTLKQMPRLVLELLAILALVGLTISMVARGRPPAEVLPTLGLFTAVAFRVMPSANRILIGMQSMSYALPSIDRLYEDISTLGTTALRRSDQLIPFERDIRLDTVTFMYPGTAAPTLAHLSLSIERGESVGIIGASGAGKSTVIDLLLGLLPPTGGQVLVDGRDIRESLRGWQDQIGYVPQVIYLTDDTMRRNIAFGLADDDIDDEAIWAAVHAAQLGEFVAGLPAGLATVVGERGVRISGGERQRIGFARALYRRPAVLVLDEATSALDAATEQSIMETVRDLKRSKTIIVVSHRMSTIEHCDRVFALRDGRLDDISVRH